MFVPLLSISWTHINQSEIVFMGQIKSQWKKYISWSNTTLVRWCMYLLVKYNWGLRLYSSVKYNLGLGDETKDRYQEQAFFSEINFSDTEAGPFFDTKDFGHKGLPSKRNSSKMRGKKALGLICGWPSRGGRKEMTSDMAQVTKQGSEVNIKCLQSTKCEISSSFPVYSAVLFFFLKIPEQENVNYQKVFLLIIFQITFSSFSSVFQKSTWNNSTFPEDAKFDFLPDKIF